MQPGLFLQDLCCRGTGSVQHGSVVRDYHPADCGVSFMPPRVMLCHVAGQLPVSWAQLPLAGLELQQNRLTGKLPPEWGTGSGTLSQVYGMNLSYNAVRCPNHLPIHWGLHCSDGVQRVLPGKVAACVALAGKLACFCTEK